ncbi:uncharacterized protein PHACADRAFT_258935 [Phanerochaete carnosa HHB-10118-sp]|uniref:Uncharacterized protein n=1 Tax=Phanerochaete carnosa (strain HHB-10118-sp) TaxID=650164 RepID=K5UXL9_PHACS|nr:uncharacterized protein PHACADRAFT_258935 [Phanerochaete carnosa HHB-10118-sp]EKM54816.1 hypothetical protein PHACADRAFT_258935 [Phanerochaete carnosa HHB-10118-sp]
MIDRQLPWVLAHFEHVRTFELIQCVCHMPYKSLHHPSCVQIESLKFKRSLAGNLRMLAPLVDPNALRSVQIDGRLDGYAEMAEALDDFLRIAGSKIEYLSVLMGWSGGRPSATSLSSLSTCTELRCLKLWLAEAWQFDFLCHNILPFIASSIRKISICFWLDWFEQFFASGPAWRNLERGLDRCLPTLDELVFDEICEAELVDRWHNQISAELSPQFRRLIRVIPQHS